VTGCDSEAMYSGEVVWRRLAVRLRRKLREGLLCDFDLGRVEEEVGGCLSFFFFRLDFSLVSFVVTDACCWIVRRLPLLVVRLLDVSVLRSRNVVLDWMEHMVENASTSTTILTPTINRAVTARSSDPVIAFILFVVYFLFLFIVVFSFYVI